MIGYLGLFLINVVFAVVPLKDVVELFGAGLILCGLALID